MMLLFCSGTSLFSQTTWTGVTSSAWNTDSNWSAGVPDATDVVTIPDVTQDPIISTAGAVAKTITVNSGGLLTIVTTGTLSINESPNQGILNEGTIQNSGTIAIGGTASVGDNGILNLNTFNNNTNGAISIDNCSSVGLANYGGIFTNVASITIGATANVGYSGIENDATFNNNTGGEISIDNSTGAGLYNISGIFTNAANITIGANTSVGYYGISNYNAFNNITGGIISIDNSTYVGLVNDGSFFNNVASFTNAARITIGATASVGDNGILNLNTFNNNTGGEISIDNSTNTGLYNDGTFTNAASVTIGRNTSVGEYGIRNTTAFNNNACATVSIFAPLHNTTSFSNTGLVSVSTTATHTNTGTVNNNGIIEYPIGNTIPNVTNNDLIVLSTKTLTCFDQIGANMLQMGGAVSFTVAANWFTDQNLTTAAGTYDQITNTFTGSGLPFGVQTLYFSTTDSTNGCTQTVSIKIDNLIAIAIEICNGLDENCNGSIDEGAGSAFYADDDGDTYGDEAVTTLACTAPDGYVTDNTDCDDTNVSANTGSTEVCDGIDNNCADGIDEGLLVVQYADIDADSFGDANANNYGCPMQGYVADNTDCDDAEAAVNPAEEEVCDDIDNDCVGGIDDNLQFYVYFSDSDVDGYGLNGDTLLSCLTEMAGFVPNADDCNDTDSAISPEATDITDGIDNNCNGVIDELSATTVTFTDLRVYPNPATDYFWVQFDIPQRDGAKIVLYNALGEVALTQALRPMVSTVSLQGLAAGVYFYSVVQGQVVVGSGKVVKL